MRKDDKGNLIGNGEDATFAILREWFPKSEIHRQKKITQLITDPEWNEITSHENKRRTIDLYFEDGPAKYCIRVNNGGKKSNFNKGNHVSDGKSRIDKIQRRDLEMFGYCVVDVPQRDCAILFKDLVNDESKKELMNCFVNY